MTTANTPPITAENIDARIAELEATAHELARQPFHLQSPRQTGEILFEKLGLPVVTRDDDGLPEINEDVLLQLASSHPLPNVLLEHRRLLRAKVHGL